MVERDSVNRAEELVVLQAECPYPVGATVDLVEADEYNVGLPVEVDALEMVDPKSGDAVGDAMIDALGASEDGYYLLDAGTPTTYEGAMITEDGVVWATHQDKGYKFEYIS